MVSSSQDMQNDSIVVSGEALFDAFVVNATSTGLALDARVGGSPFNVAVGLARLAQPVAFFGGVARGFVGDRLMQALADEGVAAGAVARLDASATLSRSASMPRAYLRMPSTARPAPTGSSRCRRWRRCRPRQWPITSGRTRWWWSRSRRPRARWWSANASAA